MRKTFKEFYLPENVASLDSLWESAYFSFDSSVLLELFDVSTETRNDWLNFVSKIPMKRRWLTFQAAREYHSGVEKVIQRHLAKEKQARNIIKSAKLPNFNDLIESKVFFSTDAKAVFDAHLTPLQDAFSTWTNGVERTIDELLAQYELDCGDTKGRIADLFDGQVGAQYDEQWLTVHHELAKIRMQNQIPPGYSDASKTGNVNGDIFVWFELLVETKKRAMPLVFVTKDQQKDDWFLKDYKNKVRCPRPELINEMRDSTGQDLVLCTLSEFLAYARTKGEIAESSVEEFAAIDEEHVKRTKKFKDLMTLRSSLDAEMFDLELEVAEFNRAKSLDMESMYLKAEALDRLATCRVQRDRILNEQWAMLIGEISKAEQT